MTLVSAIKAAGYEVAARELARVRAEAIEECARVAEGYETHVPGTAWIMDGIAEAIRALKGGGKS